MTMNEYKDKLDELLTNAEMGVGETKQNEIRLLFSNAVRNATKEGIKDGLMRYAWWKEGVQYVGTCGTTLKKALEDVDNEARFVL